MHLILHIERVKKASQSLGGIQPLANQQTKSVNQTSRQEYASTTQKQTFPRKLLL